MTKKVINNDNMLRAALYVRVSTEEQKVKGLSIEAQETALREWARKHEYIIAGVYNDAGISARKKYVKRPALQQLLIDVEAGKIDVILFTKLDRWFRNIADYYQVQEVLERHHVNWRTIHEDYDTVTASGRLKVNIMLSVAQDEADRDSERIRSIFESKRAKGEVVTGSVPTGYIIKDKKLEKDPQWQSVLETFFDMFAVHKSTYEARMEVQRQTGTLISYQLADLFLKKECYSGTFAGVDCPPYITPEQYATNQKLRKKTERKTVKNRVYLFTGIVFCGECGNRLQSSARTIVHKDGSIYEKYRYNCPSRYARMNCTNTVNIKETDIEQYLINNIDHALQDHVAQANKVTNAVQTPTHNDNAKIKRKLARLKELYINELITLDEYKKDAGELQAQLTVTKPIAPIDTSHLQNVLKEGWQTTYNSLSRERKRSFWKGILDKIIIHKDRSITIIFLG